MDPSQYVKITYKNTWSLDLIDNFQPNAFLESNNINFNKVSSSLNTCMQIYSMRVDDIANNTNKLLHNFESFKKRKKKGTFIVEDTNLKIDNIDFFDPYFNLDGFLSRELNNDGFYSMYYRENSGLNFLRYKFKKSINLQDKIICPGLERFSSFRSTENTKYEEENNEDVGNATFLDNNQVNEVQEDNFFETGPNEDYIENNINVNVETNFEEPVSFNKGWAGPNYWSIQKKRSKHEPRQAKKEKVYIDFTKPINENIIFETGNNCIEPSLIKERRKTTYNLPEDYQLKIMDLYKYIVDDGYFGRPDGYKDENKNDLNIDVDNKIDTNFNADFEGQIVEDKINFEASQEIITDLNNIKDIKIAKNILTNFTKVPKKVDISKLKQVIYDSLCEKNSLEKVCKDAIKNSKNKDVSIHYCLVSLLHLANEKNVKIENSGKEFVIKR